MIPIKSFIVKPYYFSRLSIYVLIVIRSKSCIEPSLVITLREVRMLERDYSYSRQ